MARVGLCRDRQRFARTSARLVEARIACDMHAENARRAFKVVTQRLTRREPLKGRFHWTRTLIGKSSTVFGIAIIGF